MRYFKKLSLFVVLGVFLFGETPTVQAQATSTCPRSLGEQFLDVNNVRARIVNTGGLFYRGEPHVYEVPKGSGSNAIFASGIWLAGQVGGQLRASASRYGEWELWAGPLDDTGNPPVDCVVFDRVYKVSRDNVADYEATGSAIPDLADWPTGLGAPTVDADGNEVNLLDQPLASRVGRVIDLGAGERPAILGDMSVWMVMNDRGNIHNSTDAPPIGIEVHLHAFAFNTAGALGDATFYKYNIFYKGDVPLTETYMGIFSDPDLGDFDDDWIGSDTLLGVGFVYNSDNEDGGGEGYGTPPPAAGYDFLQGPIVPSVGDTAFVSGVAVPDFKNLGMTSFIFYNNGGGVTEDPTTGPHYYGYMKAEWKDGQKFTFGGNGRDFSEDPTNFVFPGDPSTNQFWSERNSDNLGTSIEPGDRRFVLSTGPFTINPGDEQEIIFGLIFEKGDDNFDSVRALREADALAQSAFDVNFQLATPPNAPDITVTELDHQIILEWSNRADRSNNYLESYSEEDPFAPPEDQNYDFEGYKVFQFTEAADQIGTVIATYDIVNGVQEVIDGIPFKPTFVVASGTDNGIVTFHSISSLINYQSYHFGVQAYAFNEPSFPKIYPSPIARVTVVPKPPTGILSDAAVEASLSFLGFEEADFQGDDTGNIGLGRVWADIVNPGAIVADATYEILFYEFELAGKRSVISSVTFDSDDIDAMPLDRYGMPLDGGNSASKGADTAITYDILRRDDAGITVLFAGSFTGVPAPLRANLVVFDGLMFSITGPAPGMTAFLTIANAAGPIVPPDMAAFGFNSSGFPLIACEADRAGRNPDGFCDRPTSGVQQSTNGSTWGIHTGGTTRSAYGNEAGPFNSGNTYIGRSIREGWDPIGSDNYEWRYTQNCLDHMDGSTDDQDGCLAWRGFEDGLLVEVPFEVWNVGPTDDSADDFQMLPLICESACGGGTEDFKFDLTESMSDGSGDHPLSGGTNDPFTDWIYFYKPADNGASPGRAGYLGFFHGPDDVGDRTFSRQVLVNWNGGTGRPYDAELPEAGTVFKYVTKKPSLPGDNFTFITTEGEVAYGVQEASQQTKQDRLDEIGIVPNPYKGSSAYERSQLIDEVRFTGMPGEETIINVFTLNGSLIKTIFKPEGVRNQAWNLTTDNSLPLASGMYLIHVDVKGVGSRVIKFAVIKKRVQLNTF